MHNGRYEKLFITAKRRRWRLFSTPDILTIQPSGKALCSDALRFTTRSILDEIVVDITETLAGSGFELDRTRTVMQQLPELGCKAVAHHKVWFKESTMRKRKRKPQSVRTLEEFGRIRLSDSFFMRDFLYSEISQIEGIPNIPDDPDLAIEVGSLLCKTILEPIQAKFGRVSIRSAYRASAVNAKGAENGNQYSCACNEANYAGHIWDRKDSNGQMGATACIVVGAFLPYYERTSHWQALAWWIHDHIPAYSDMEFYPKLAAFNISWQEKPNKEIYSYVAPKGWLTKPDMPNHGGSHEHEYAEFLRELEILHCGPSDVA